MPSSPTKTAPYGSWKSPITSDLIVAQSIALSDVRLDGGHVYWLEGRPQERGRSVVVRAEADGRQTDITPAPYNARTRVHEYGGGSWTVRDGTVYFSNFADGRLYRQVPDASTPQPLTPPPPARDRQWRFADGVIDPRRQRWIGVREDHTAAGEPVNTIVAVDLAGRRRAGRVLARGHDFYASPRLSPDGHWLAWLAWDHPNMPWNGTLLYLAEIGAQGALGEPRPIAGGTDGIDLPAGMVARRRAHRVRVRPLRLVESLRLRPGSAHDAAAGADGGGVRRAAMDVRHVELCFRRTRTDRLRLCAGRTRAARRAGSDARHVDARSTPPSPNSARCARRATASCFAPARPTIPPASLRSILAPAATPC